MTTEMIKLQVTIPRRLADALTLAATNDRRSRPRFIVNLLEDSLLVKEALRTMTATPPLSPLPVVTKSPPVDVATAYKPVYTPPPKPPIPAYDANGEEIVPTPEPATLKKEFNFDDYDANGNYVGS